MSRNNLNASEGSAFLVIVHMSLCVARLAGDVYVLSSGSFSSLKAISSTCTFCSGKRLELIIGVVEILGI